MGSQIVRKILIEMMVQTESKLNALLERKFSLKFGNQISHEPVNILLDPSTC